VDDSLGGKPKYHACADPYLAGAAIIKFSTPLPIDAVMGDVREALASRPRAILVAPPGSGKTTRVPLALMDEDWAEDRKILVLEPRRIAAHAAAERMAQSLSEVVGERIGLRARMVSKSGPRTRVEVVTEGVFTRMILEDPGLDGVGAVLFDEIHERSLDADLGLALALDCQRHLRNDMRIMPMSATLDCARVSQLLEGAPVITSEDRAHSVETRYLGRDAGARIEDQMADAVLLALRVETGSILAFLPGQREIRRVEERLRERINLPCIVLAPLYGAMDMNAQHEALRTPREGFRKVVLATSIAETSITIEGVSVVIDSGLARVPRFEPDVGVTRLETVRASRATADQRRGRAGRTGPGVCYRLWDEQQTQSLPAFAEPEIRSADLAGLLLDCLEWGAADPRSLSWIDPPATAAIDAARKELRNLGAVDAEGRITPAGRQLRALPLPPRLAHAVMAAAALGHAEEAAEVAAVIVEQGLGGNDADIAHRLENFRRDRSRRGGDMRRLAAGWARMAQAGCTMREPREAMSIAELLALAFPERIGKARGAPGHYLLANGRGASIDTAHPLARAPFLVAAELSGTAAATRILLAAAAEEADIRTAAHERIRERDEIEFHPGAAALRGRRVRRLDAIILASAPLEVAANEETARLLAKGIAELGLGRLPWSKAQTQCRYRVEFLRANGEDGWPDLADAALEKTVEHWLAPFLKGKTKLSEITTDDLGAALDTLLPWHAKQRLEQAAPTHFQAPTGNHHAIDYDTPGAPALHVRVQELFGLTRHPAIANGKLPLTLHLLSPARRLIQITRDLPGFWKGSWAAVKAEMRGRYPRHPWPDDPTSAAPTARAKPRGT
jgi:ATP-dependent helicase HrpB